MARPQSNNVDYFPMWTKKSKTEEVLESKFGRDGECFLFKLFRILADEDGHFFDARNPIDIEFLAQKLNLNPVSVTEILACLSSWGKIDPEMWQSGVIWYQGFVNNLKHVYSKRNRPVPTKFDACKKLGISVPEINSFDLDDDEFPAQKLEEMGVSGPESTQSKVKKKRDKISLPLSSAKATESGSDIPPTPQTGDAAAFSGKFLGGEKQPPLTDLPEDAESLIEEKTKIREADKSKAALKNRESYKADLRKALRENPDEIIAWREMSKKRKLDAAVADQKKLDEEIRRKADDEMRKSISEKHDRFFALLKQFDKLAKLERQRIDDRVTQKYLANNPEAKKLSGMRFNPRSRMLAVELLPYYEEIFEEYEYQFEPK